MSQFDEMQTFIRVVEAGSITKAAEQMDTVKSAVSRRLSELEKRLGVALITRTTRTQTLTDAGRSYYQQCLRIIADLEEVEAALSNTQCSLKGQIKIAVPLTFGLNHLAPALDAFNREHPDIVFDLDFNDRKVDLIEEGYDLAIRISRLEDSSLIARKLTSGWSILCASKAYIERYGEPLVTEDLDTGHVRVKYSLTQHDWQLRNREGALIKVKLPHTINANNGDFLLQQAIEGKGLIVSPDFICYQAVQDGLLYPILTQYYHREELPIYAIYPQTRHLSHRVRRLVDFLKDYFGSTPYWRIS